MTAEITPVILSGGSGTRLWPLSVPDHPKQLHALVGENTMIQDTVIRCRGMSGVTAPVVVCNAVQAPAVALQLEEIGSPPRDVIVEPVGRNTAPAVAAACLLVDLDTVVAVLPADHVITDVPTFHAALGLAVEAADGGSIVTFGVVPSRPDTGFGYIEPGGVGAVTDLVRFVEKPDLATAGEYVEAGYLWNSGMFVFRAGTMLEEMAVRAPEVLAAARSAVDDAARNESTFVLGEAFEQAPSVSIDNAVMEPTRLGAVVRLDAGWSDVGSWQALWEVAARDGGTATVGDVFTLGVERSYIRSTSRPVAVMGLEDVVVVETAEAVLVVDRDRVQDVRLAAEWFKDLTRE